jgi:hypothetical protein
MAGGTRGGVGRSLGPAGGGASHGVNEVEAGGVRPGAC